MTRNCAERTYIAGVIEQEWQVIGMLGCTDYISCTDG